MLRGSNNEQKELTRQCLFDALMILWEQKPYDKITITEITRKAGVSRMAFYRNYQTKDEIVWGRLKQLNDEYLADLARETAMRIEDFTVHLYEYVQENAAFIQKVMDAGFGWMQLRLIEAYMEHPDAFQLSDVDSRVFQNENLRHFIAGGYGSMISSWLGGGMKESPQDIGAEMARFVKRLASPMMGEDTVLPE